MIDNKQPQWPQQGLLETDGILVGCDSKQEWLLPWWWENYCSFNHHPVSFVDLGMSEEARQWCEEKGELLLCENCSSCAASKEEIDHKVATHWEAVYGEDLWVSRSAWFKKPICMMQSPYKRTLWLDLDCEILSSLTPLFSYCESPSGLAVAQESLGSQMQEMSQGLLLPKEVLYNTGVVVFARRSPLLLRWAQEAMEQSHRFWGDEQLLSRIIFKEHFPIREIPEIYNWRMSQGLNLNAAVVHWVGRWGKAYIKKHGGLRKDVEAFFQSVDGLPRSDL